MSPKYIFIPRAGADHPEPLDRGLRGYKGLHHEGTKAPSWG